jgi:NADH-quinone oxidoreductase subunit A
LPYFLGYTYVAVFLLFGILIPVGALLANRLLAPRHPDPEKLQAYECGLATPSDNTLPYNVRYYIFALLFVVFDVETIFLYPWAVAFNRLGLFAFVEMIVFIGILVVGLVYAWKKRLLEWL